MKVQTVGEAPATIEVEDNGDGTYTDADGQTYQLQHHVGVFTYVAKAEAIIDDIEDAIAGELEVEKVEEPPADEAGNFSGEDVSPDAEAEAPEEA